MWIILKVFFLILGGKRIRGTTEEENDESEPNAKKAATENGMEASTSTRPKRATQRK